MSSQQPYNSYQQTQPPIPQDSSQSSGYQQYYQPPQQEYSFPSPYAFSSPLPQDPGRGAALAGLILGIAGLFFFPAAIAGLITSIIGLRSVSRRRLAVIGLVLSSIIVGFYLLFAIIAIIGHVAAPQ